MAGRLSRSCLRCRNSVPLPAGAHRCCKFRSNRDQPVNLAKGVRFRIDLLYRDCQGLREARKVRERFKLAGMVGCVCLFCVPGRPHRPAQGRTSSIHIDYTLVSLIQPNEECNRTYLECRFSNESSSATHCASHCRKTPICFLKALLTGSKQLSNSISFSLLRSKP